MDNTKINVNNHKMKKSNKISKKTKEECNKAFDRLQ